VDAGLLAAVRAALGLAADEVLAAQWLDNGPDWLTLRLPSAERVLAVQPDQAALKSLAKVGLVGAYPAGGEVDVELRAFAAPLGVAEDPVTGSLNASVAQWLMAEGVLPERYVASQGQALGRAGRIYLQRDGEGLWVGGDVAACIAGTVRL
jgi:PhzF family phenazine biosynthesis protein